MSVVDHNVDFWDLALEPFVEHAIGSQTSTYTPIYIIDPAFGAAMAEGITFRM
jgi:hypothetical protein